MFTFVFLIWQELSGINHQVFLNFRGKDTRKGFTGLLYDKLKNARIEIFKDDKNLRAGDEIDQALKDAIEHSKISIAIFSQDYASSESCLMELEHMWECRESNERTLIPIFYDINPDDVTNQTGKFEESFKNHKKIGKVNSNTIEKWRIVLQLVGD